MKEISAQLSQRNTLNSILIDFGALLFIYLIPAISHLFNVPVYLIEPMRLMLIFTLVHTNKTNAYIIAVSMPLFSFLISGHPVFPKMILIAFELSLNVYLFYFFLGKIKSAFPSIFLSIFLSKIIYYLLKFGLVSMVIIDGAVISTPLTIQLITTLVFSLYVFFFYKKK